MTTLPKLLTPEKGPSQVLSRVCEILCTTAEGRLLAELLRDEFRQLGNERDLWAKEAHELVARFVNKQ